MVPKNPVKFQNQETRFRSYRSNTHYHRNSIVVPRSSVQHAPTCRLRRGHHFLAQQEQHPFDSVPQSRIPFTAAVNN
eukprot:3357763-Rhodomonas_salina.2